jgi:hypothetical protein
MHRRCSHPPTPPNAPSRHAPCHDAAWRPQATDTATHRWTAYVRGANNEDLSPLIQKVATPE